MFARQTNANRCVEQQQTMEFSFGDNQSKVIKWNTERYLVVERRKKLYVSNIQSHGIWFLLQTLTKNMDENYPRTSNDTKDRKKKCFFVKLVLR